MCHATAALHRWLENKKHIKNIAQIPTVTQISKATKATLSGLMLEIGLNIAQNRFVHIQPNATNSKSRPQFVYNIPYRRGHVGLVYKIPYRRARAWPSASREQRYLAYNAWPSGCL